MKFGEKYNIHGYKHNGDLYKVWDETIFLAQTDDYYVFANNKIKVTINTDNMTVSGTDEASEMKLICDTFGYDGNMRRIFVDNAIDAAFLSNEMKEKLRGNL